MNIKTWLKNTTDLLQKNDVPTARLDSLVFLEDALGKDRSWLLAHQDHTLHGPLLKKLEIDVIRRTKHEPMAYIRGKSEFFGREFLVNAHTLQPRPETETMIELLQKWHAKFTDDFSLIDVGTGSGALAITAKLELPDAEVLATDIDVKCLSVAQKNAKNLEASVTFYKANLLNPQESNVQQLPSNFIILTNLPYVPDDHPINKAANFEPKHAIFGGLDGLDLYRKLFLQINELICKPKYIFTESLPDQHHKLATIARDNNYALVDKLDFIQVFEHMN